MLGQLPPFMKETQLGASFFGYQFVSNVRLRHASFQLYFGVPSLEAAPRLPLLQH